MLKKKKVKEFIANCKRVLVVAKKPDMDEFLKSLKITSAAVAIIGLLGFVIFTTFQLII